MRRVSLGLAFAAGLSAGAAAAAPVTLEMFGTFGFTVGGTNEFASGDKITATWTFDNESRGFRDSATISPGISIPTGREYGAQSMTMTISGRSTQTFTFASDSGEGRFFLRNNRTTRVVNANQVADVFQGSFTDYRTGIIGSFRMSETLPLTGNPEFLRDETLQSLTAALPVLAESPIRGSLRLNIPYRFTGMGVDCPRPGPDDEFISESGCILYADLSEIRIQPPAPPPAAVPLPATLPVFLAALGIFALMRRR